MIIEQHQPVATPMPGIAHSTWAGSAEGLTQLAMWRQSLAPAAATPPHSHECDEVVLCMGGVGEVHIEGRAQRFGAGQTVILPRGGVHQLFNVGTTPLEILGVFGAAPVVTRLPDGAPVELPWKT